eukprot:2499150-Pleurochrysis_carterae.AAC.1
MLETRHTQQRAERQAVKRARHEPHAHQHARTFTPHFARCLPAGGGVMTVAAEIDRLTMHMRGGRGGSVRRWSYLSPHLPSATRKTFLVVSAAAEEAGSSADGETRCRVHECVEVRRSEK